MSKKKHTAEEIINKLREAEVLQAKGQTLEEMVRQLGISSVTYYKIESFNGKLRDELLNEEIFDSMYEAEVVTEQWRKHYNTIRPLSSLKYRPPTPETFYPLQIASA
jgi:transposase InsO family protein